MELEHGKEFLNQVEPSSLSESATDDAVVPYDLTSQEEMSVVELTPGSLAKVHPHLEAERARRSMLLHAD